MSFRKRSVRPTLVTRKLLASSGECKDDAPLSDSKDAEPHPKIETKVQSSDELLAADGVVTGCKNTALSSLKSDACSLSQESPPGSPVASSVKTLKKRSKFAPKLGTDRKPKPSTVSTNPENICSSTSSNDSCSATLTTSSTALTCETYHNSSKTKGDTHIDLSCGDKVNGNDSPGLIDIVDDSYIESCSSGIASRLQQDDTLDKSATETVDDGPDFVKESASILCMSPLKDNDIVSKVLSHSGTQQTGECLTVEQNKTNDKLKQCLGQSVGQDSTVSTSSETTTHASSSPAKGIKSLSKRTKVKPSIQSNRKKGSDKPEKSQSDSPCSVEVSLGVSSDIPQSAAKCDSSSPSLPDENTCSSKKLGKRTRVKPIINARRSKSSVENKTSEIVQNETATERTSPVPNQDVVGEGVKLSTLDSSKEKLSPSVDDTQDQLTKRVRFESAPEDCSESNTSVLSQFVARSTEEEISSQVADSVSIKEKPSDPSLSKIPEVIIDPSPVSKYLAAHPSGVERSADNSLPDTTKEGSLSNKSSHLRVDTTEDGLTSQSEGEMSDSAHRFMKKKTFRPNVAAKRRKRLSSFSAYSDDEMEKSGKARKSEGEKLSESQVDEGTAKTEKKKTKRRKRKKKGTSDETGGSEKEKKNSSSSTRSMNMYITEERDINTLTMHDLIYYKPKSLKTVALKNDTSKPADYDGKILGARNQSQSSITKKEESKDFIDAKPSSLANMSGNKEADVMAPQVMVNDDGEIVINESSLVVDQVVDDSALKKREVVFEDALTYKTHRKNYRGKRWPLQETLRFYKALSQIGTDFTLMSKAFPKYTRRDLKQKFKREEKINCDLIDMALSSRLPLNMSLFLTKNEEDDDIADVSSLNIPEDGVSERVDENDVGGGGIRDEVTGVGDDLDVDMSVQ